MLWCLHFVDVTRIMLWVVSFSSLRPFGRCRSAQVTQDQFWQLTCDLSTPGTQPYALCGLTTCSGLEEYPDVAACKCAPETVNEMFQGALSVF